MNRRYHSVTTDYTGRTVDMLLLQFVSAPEADILVRPDVSRDPRMTTGVEKLAQRYALLFLTQVGTVKNRESEGSNFLGLLGAGQIYDENTLRSAAAAANKTVSTQIKVADRNLGTADDEALDTADVTDTSVDRATASVSVTVAITTVAGERYVYTIPLATGV